MSEDLKGRRMRLSVEEVEVINIDVEPLDVYFALSLPRKIMVWTKIKSLKK